MNEEKLVDIATILLEEEGDIPAGRVPPPEEEADAEQEPEEG